MAVERSAQYERMSLEAYLAVVEQDPEHAYEYLDGRVCPDVTVSCDVRDRGAQEVIRYPCLVAEVLSPTTEARDRGQKSLQYHSCPSMQEYLLSSSEFPLFEVFRREKQEFWSLYTLGPKDTIELTSLNPRFPVAELYHNTSFLEDANG